MKLPKGFTRLVPNRRAAYDSWKGWTKDPRVGASGHGYQQPFRNLKKKKKY